MAVETRQEKQNAGHYQDANAAKIQNAITVLSDMESRIGDLSGQVSDMKRRLLAFAETESEKAKIEVIDQANKEAQAALEQLRRSAQKEADGIVAKGMNETNDLKAKISGKVAKAVDIIVDAVQTV